MKNIIDNIRNRKFVASYSGGKDSTLAIYPAGILVMLEEDGKRSRAHSIPIDLIKAQGRSMGIDLIMASASWESYEDIFVKNILEIKANGAEVLVTGDIDMPEHGCWYEKIANKVGLDLSAGMKEEDLGRILTLEYIKELGSRGIDSCGENGEFYTTVINGPIFNERIKVKHGEITKDGRYMYLKLELDK